MKTNFKYAVFASLSVFTSTLYAAGGYLQYDNAGTPTDSSVYYDSTNMRLGVGTSGPLLDFHVDSQYSVFTYTVPATGIMGRFIMNAKDGSMEMASGNDGVSYLDFKGDTHVTEDYVGRILFNDAAGFRILGNGAFFPSTATLFTVEGDAAIAGQVKAQEILVTSTGWADYVFEKDYDLPKIKDVEAFINENQHLPGVPSAQQIEKQGLNLGETQAILLKKIEELTLYIIELDKKIEHNSK